MRPLDALDINLTGSIGSLVPPIVNNTLPFAPVLPETVAGQRVSRIESNILSTFDGTKGTKGMKGKLRHR